MAEHESEPLGLPIEWHISDDLTCQYATNLVVQHTDHEFVLSFFRAFPPIVLGSPEDVKQQLEDIGSVRHDCIARVIVAASKMPEFLDVLQRNLETYLSMHEGEEEPE